MRAGRDGRQFYQPRNAAAGGRRVSARGRHARAAQQRTYPARVRSLQRPEPSLPRDGVYRRDHARAEAQRRRRQAVRGRGHRRGAAGARHARVSAQSRTAGDLSRPEAVERDADAVGASEADRFRNRAPVPAAQQRDDDRHARLRAARAISRQGRVPLRPVRARRHDASRAIGPRPRARAAVQLSAAALALSRRHARAVRAGRSGAQVRRGPARGRRRGVQAAADGDQVGEPDYGAAAQFVDCRARRVHSSSCRSAGSSPKSSTRRRRRC